MGNKTLRDQRILLILQECSYRWMTCEDIFHQLCLRSTKNGVKSTKALSKILPRFPLMKNKKVVVARDSMGVELCNYITIYKLDPLWEQKIKKELTA